MNITTDTKGHAVQRPPGRMIEAATVVERLAVVLRVLGMYIGPGRLRKSLRRPYRVYCVVVSILSLAVLGRTAAVILLSVGRFTTFITSIVGCVIIATFSSIPLVVWLTGKHLPLFVTRWQQLLDRQGGDCSWVKRYEKLVTIGIGILWILLILLPTCSVAIWWMLDDKMLFHRIFIPGANYDFSESHLQIIYIISNLHASIHYVGGTAFLFLYILLSLVVRKHFSLVREMLAGHIRDKGLGADWVVEPHTSNSKITSNPQYQGEEAQVGPKESETSLGDKKVRDIDDIRIEYEAVVQLMETADDLFTYMMGIFIAVTIGML